MRKILHLADLHLGFAHRYLGDRAPQRAEEALKTLERVVDWALDDAHQIGAVLIAGDLFETHEDPDPRLTGRVISTLKRVVGEGRALVTVPGNHDEISYPESVYRVHADTWPGVLVRQPLPGLAARFDLDGTPCAVYSMAYTAGLSPNTLPAVKLEEEDEEENEVRLALLHGTLDAEPADRTYRIDSSTLREARIAYAALGHIHKPAEVRVGDGLGVYPGTLNGKGFDDPGVSELVVVSFSGGLPQIERVPFPVRPIQTRSIDLAHYPTMEALIRDLEAGAQSNLILRLEPHGPCPEDFDQEYFLGRLRESFFHLELNDRSLMLSDQDIERIAQQPTVKGMFVRHMQERIAAQAENDAVREVERLALRKGLAAFDAARREH